jgi:hypothetical protein
MRVVHNDVQQSSDSQERKSSFPRSSRQIWDEEIVHRNQCAPRDRFGDGAWMTIDEEQSVLWFTIPLHPIP